MSEFHYVGRSGDPSDSFKFEKTFDDDYDATSYADENIYQYPIFKVTDEDGDVIYSNKMSDKGVKGILNDMFPEGEDD